MAVQKDYEHVEMHEVYEYQVTRYDPQTSNGSLFAQYTENVLKLKAEASGYPSWVQCPEDEDRYISEFDKSKGIQLDRDAIGSNTSKRV